MTTKQAYHWNNTRDTITEAIQQVGLYETLLAVSTAIDESGYPGVSEQLSVIRYPHSHGEYLRKDTIK